MYKRQGIAIAGIASQYFDYVPVVFAKKTESLNLDKDVYESNVHSFTKKKDDKVRVGKQFVNKEMCIRDRLYGGFMIYLKENF